MWQKIAAKCFEKLYIQYGKRCWQNVLNDYIYRLAKDDGKSFFIFYIYRLAKDDGKSFEIHTDNYRQL